MHPRLTQYIMMHKDWRLCVEMPDGSKWSVPVMVIAAHRAQTYASKYDAPTEFEALERSLVEDTLPLFERDSDHIIRHWAETYMRWSDVCEYATLQSSPDTTSYQEGWRTGSKHVLGGRDPESA